MSGDTPVRKRDRFRGIFGKPAKEPPGASGTSHPSVSTALGNGSLQSVPASSPTPSLQTYRPPRDFLKDALKELTEKDRSVIQEHVAFDIGDTVKAAYDAAEKQKTICRDKRWPGNDKADKVLLWLDRFKSVGNVVANVDPVHVGLPWAGIRMLLEVCLQRWYILW